MGELEELPKVIRTEEGKAETQIHGHQFLQPSLNHFPETDPETHILKYEAHSLACTFFLE